MADQGEKTAGTGQMIPTMHIIAWSRVAPWAAPRQVEQDLIISRAVVDLFDDEFLNEQLRFRGGTALHKLHFPSPLRYSEDIDLVRTTAGGIGPVLDRVRHVLGWLGEARYEATRVAPKLMFRVEAEDGGEPLRLKVEINTREREVHDDPIEIDHTVDNPWFAGHASDTYVLARRNVGDETSRIAAAKQGPGSVRPGPGACGVRDTRHRACG